MIELIENTILWDQLCWRYLKIDRLINSLREGYIYFAAANQFEDEWEGATFINSADYCHTGLFKPLMMFNNAFKQLQRLTKINCWHKSDYENYAMWKLYANDKKGVAITTTPRLMKLSIEPYRIKPNYVEENLIIGDVNYNELDLENQNKSEIERFFNKHISFSYEKEIRLTVSLRLAEECGVIVPDEGIKLKVDYSKLIESIIIGPNIDLTERKLLMNVLIEEGLESKLKDSVLSKKPWFL